MSNRIVYIIGGVWNGSGMERVLTMKANYMADVAGYEVHILLTEDGEGPSYFPISEKIQMHNVHINFDILHRLPIYKRIFAYLRKQHLYKRRLTEYLMHLKPDITVSAMRREINFINSINDGSKKIGEIHFSRIGYREVNFKFCPPFMNRMISRWWMDQLLKQIKKLAAFVVLSEEDKLNWPEISNTKVIHNPISISAEFSSRCISKNIIAVGRYTHQKGFDLLAETWKIVASKHLEWTLNIYGGGDADYYRQLAIQKGISKTFICNGPVHDIAAKYLESSIFVLSSRHEGFPLVIAEAMTSGLPVISFACPCGPRDIIEDGINGFLVENGNISLLAEKIIYLIEHEEIRVEMGENAIHSVKCLEMEQIGSQWINLFESVKNK